MDNMGYHLLNRAFQQNQGSATPLTQGGLVWVVSEPQMFVLLLRVESCATSGCEVASKLPRQFGSTIRECNAPVVLAFPARNDLLPADRLS